MATGSMQILNLEARDRPYSALAAVRMQMDAADWFLMALGLLVFAALLLWVGAAAWRPTGGWAPSEDSALHLLDPSVGPGRE